MNVQCPTCNRIFDDAVFTYHCPHHPPIGMPANTTYCRKHDLFNCPHCSIATGYKIDIPPHGYVLYVDKLGSDQRVVEAARVSYGSPSKGEEQDKKLLDYLFRNRHTSPFEQCSITFNIKFPIFLMRQFVRHRMFRLNEWSGRYSELADQFYMPSEFRVQDTKNKQAGIVGGFIDQEFCKDLLEDAYSAAYNTYKNLLNMGVCKEQARFVLPVGIYTEIYVNCDLHNLMHFLRLRLDSHAQAEMQEIARAMLTIATLQFPWTFEAFNKYELKMVERE